MRKSLRFRSFRTVPAAALLSIADSFGIEDTADDVVTDTRKVFHASSAHKHHAVFLKIVTLTHDVGLHFVTVCETHTGDLSESGVWLLGRHRRHLYAHTSLERRTLRKWNRLHL